MKLESTLSMFAARASARVRRLLLIIIACMCMAACVSAQTEKPLPAEPEPEKEVAGEQCEWACERWTKTCNVDPRGVYKCRRTCAKFGEVCE